MTPGKAWKLYTQKVCSQISDLGTDGNLDLDQLHSPISLPSTEP